MLARKSRRLIAVELDRVLSAQLRMKFSMQPNVEIIEGDILTIELDTVFGAKPGSVRTGLNFAPEPARVVGNLPYYITSDILLRLLQYHRYFSTIVIMVQKEVADRLAASPGTPYYAFLSPTTPLPRRLPHPLRPLPVCVPHRGGPRRAWPFVVRPPAVAGRFYPGRAADLLRDVREYTSQGETATPAGRIAAIGCIAPHAGYTYSGGVAGAVYARVE